jgi:hypothetical protein
MLGIMKFFCGDALEVARALPPVAHSCMENKQAHSLVACDCVSRAFIPHFVADEMMMRSYATSQLRRIAAGA